jgi:RNA polymerase sigma-70 factor (ECF subfamily)
MEKVDLRAVGARERASDFELATRCIAGDPTAQRELFERERSHVHRALYRVLGSNAAMEDLVQEAFLEIFRSLKGFRGEAQLATWVTRIAVRVAYAHIGRTSARRKNTVHLESVPELPAEDPSAERRAVARQATMRLYGILRQVEPKRRIAFTLHVLDGRPLREVAELMEATLVATKTRVWRARREIEHQAAVDPVLVEFLRSANGRTGAV